MQAVLRRSNLIPGSVNTTVTTGGSSLTERPSDLHHGLIVASSMPQSSSPPPLESSASDPHTTSPGDPLDVAGLLVDEFGTVMLADGDELLDFT
jgi:hypothetical protein